MAPLNTSPISSESKFRTFGEKYEDSYLLLMLVDKRIFAQKDFERQAFDTQARKCEHNRGEVFLLLQEQQKPADITFPNFIILPLKNKMYILQP